MKYIAYAIGDKNHYDYHVDSLPDNTTEDMIDNRIKSQALRTRIQKEYDTTTLFAEWHFIDKDEYYESADITCNL